MSGPDDRTARLALSCVVDAGDPSLAELLAETDATVAWSRVASGALGEAMARRAAAIDHRHLAVLARHYRLRFVVPGDDEWPARLDDLRHVSPIQRRGGVPVGLWLRGPGHLGELASRAVAVVGSRAATPYGIETATQLAADLADAGMVVVSGGAYGIDTAAHRGALSAGGVTIAVMANGADVVYPKGNAPLLETIARDHLIVSELPPGAAPSRVRFLARNRLIAAISAGTVVVEAAHRSGARNTASWAVDCGRHLMAVPGPVYSALSAGPHQLVRDGKASLVTSGGEVLELVAPMGSATVPAPRGAQRATDLLDERRLAVFEALPARSYAPVGEIARRAGVAVPTALAELTALEQVGLAEGSDRGWRTSPAECPVQPG